MNHIPYCYHRNLIFVDQLDSLLGATLQRTRYSENKKRILQDASVPGAKDSIKVVSGLNLLNNNQVRHCDVICHDLTLIFRGLGSR